MIDSPSKSCTPFLTAFGEVSAVVLNSQRESVSNRFLHVACSTGVYKDKIQPSATVVIQVELITVSDSSIDQSRHGSCGGRTCEPWLKPATRILQIPLTETVHPEREE